MKKLSLTATKNLFVDPLRALSLGAVVFCLSSVVSVSAVKAQAQELKVPGFQYKAEDFFNFEEDKKPSSPAARAAALGLVPAVPSAEGGNQSGAAGVPGQPGLPPGLDPSASVLSQQTLDAIEEETRRQAFDAALDGLMPLRPEEIRTLLERYDRTQESVELPVYPAPKPQIAVETLSLDPGMKPKTISVSHGYVTTFTVVDSTGAPWPIEDITWAGDFEIIEAGGESSHFIRITPRSEYAFGNMSMRLIGLQTPIILSLETARDIVHYRFDAIVPKIGPFAQTPLIETGVTVTAGDSRMVRILEGGPPMGATKLEVAGTDDRTTAFDYDGMTYLRTPLTLLSPAWVKSTSSSDGMRVYAMNQTPVVLLSENGRMVRVRLSPRGDFQ